MVTQIHQNTMLDHLPRDLQLQILKRLPLISILISRTLSKSFNSLITTQHFISQHLKFTKSINHNQNHQLLILYFDRTHKTERYVTAKDDETLGLHFSNIEFQYATKTAYFRIVGYCDGVICLSDDLFDSMCMVVLWNPSIRKSVRVLIPNYEQNWPHVIVLGFGVCPMTHDPKIIRIVYVDSFSTPCLITNEDPTLVEVFSLASSAWRKPRNRPRKTIQFTWSQVCLNGVIHWVACDKQIDQSFCCLIVSFDLVCEVFDEMPLPDALACEHVSNLLISNREGHLTMLEYDMGKGRECCGIWVMKEYGVVGSWEKLYIIRLPGMLRKVVGFRMNGEMILALKNHELVFVERSGNVKSLVYMGIYDLYLLDHIWNRWS